MGVGLAAACQRWCLLSTASEPESELGVGRRFRTAGFNQKGDKVAAAARWGRPARRFRLRNDAELYGAQEGSTLRIRTLFGEAGRESRAARPGSPRASQYFSTDPGALTPTVARRKSRGSVPAPALPVVVFRRSANQHCDRAEKGSRVCPTNNHFSNNYILPSYQEKRVAPNLKQALIVS
jgi:hypothetical protein